MTFINKICVKQIRNKYIQIKPVEGKRHMGILCYSSDPLRVRAEAGFCNADLRFFLSRA